MDQVKSLYHHVLKSLATGMFIFSLHYNRTESTSKQYASSYGQEVKVTPDVVPTTAVAVQLFEGSGGN